MALRIAKDRQDSRATTTRRGLLCALSCALPCAQTHRVVRGERASTAARAAMCSLTLAATVGLCGMLGGCQGSPDFVISDAFAKDLPLSLANTLEGAIESQAQAQGATMDAMAVAGAPLGPEDVAQRYEDVRVAMVVAERRVRTARARYESAEGRMHSLVMQWKRETRVISDPIARQDSERRLDALERGWSKVEDAASAREESHQAALKLVNERVVVLRHARAGNAASGAIAANPAPWPVLKAGPIQDAVLREGDAFMRACRDMRAMLPTTEVPCATDSAQSAQPQAGIASEASPK